MKRVVIIGAGVSGKIIARGLKDRYKDSLEVVLIGPDQSEAFPELFYFNQKVPGICEKEIQVTYDELKDPEDDGSQSWQIYQKKSRGVNSNKVSTSSLSLVGQTVTGYLPSREISFEDISRNLSQVTNIVLDDKFVSTPTITYGYDYLISTVPLNIFMKLTDNINSRYLDEFQKSVMPIYQSRVDGPAKDFDSIKIYYDLHKNTVFYRHSSYFHGSEVVKLVSESIKDFDGATSVLRPGKILPSDELTRFVKNFEEAHPDIILCGRYARWEYHYTADQSYYDAIKFISKNFVNS